MGVIMSALSLYRRSRPRRWISYSGGQSINDSSARWVASSHSPQLSCSCGDDDRREIGMPCQVEG